jgi:hypothetical protein
MGTLHLEESFEIVNPGNLRSSPDDMTIFVVYFERHETVRPELMTMMVLLLVDHPCEGEPTTFVIFEG